MFNRSSSNPSDPEGIRFSIAIPDDRPGRESNTGLAGALRTNLEMTGAKPSIISEQFVLVGNIQAPGDLLIEGTVKGDLEVASATIGHGGVLEGNVVCWNLQIRGRFKGKAVCRELFVASTAQVDGEITYQEVSVQRGAGLRGAMHVAAFHE